MGCAGVKRETIILALCRAVQSVETGASGVSMWKGRIEHGASLTIILIFSKHFSVRAPSRPRVGAKLDSSVVTGESNGF
jgi:hypothetical protein